MNISFNCFQTQLIHTKSPLRGEIAKLIQKYSRLTYIFIISSKKCQHCFKRNEVGFPEENQKMFNIDLNSDFYKNLITGFTNMVKFRVFELYYEEIDKDSLYDISEYFLMNDTIICYRYGENSTIKLNFSDQSIENINHLDFGKYKENIIPIGLREKIFAFPDIISFNHNIFFQFYKPRNINENLKEFIQSLN